MLTHGIDLSFVVIFLIFQTSYKGKQYRGSSLPKFCIRIPQILGICCFPLNACKLCAKAVDGYF